MTNRTNPWNIIGILCFIALTLMVFLSTYS